MTQKPRTSSTSNAPRYPWIDYLKALGILLVVGGHTALPTDVHNWIYAFHMPLFFLISGFLISPGAFAVPFSAFFKRRVSKIIWLYFAFGLLGAAAYCYFFKQEHTLSEMLKGRAWALLYGSGSLDSPEDLFPVVLWYFPALVTGMVIAFGIWKVPTAWGKALATVAVFISGVLLSPRALPWELESGCLAAGFIVAGHCVRLAGWDARLQKSGSRILPIGLGVLLLGSYLAYLNHSCLDVRLAALGNPLLALPAAGLLVAGWMVVVMRLPVSRIVTAVAAATILIFPIHTMAFPYVDRIAAKLPMLRDGVAGNLLWYCWAKALLVVAGLTLAHFCYTSIKSRGGKTGDPGEKSPVR